MSAAIANHEMTRVDHAEILRLFRAGFDTWDIKEQLRCEEPEVCGALAEALQVERSIRSASFDFVAQIKRDVAARHGVAVTEIDSDRREAFAARREVVRTIAAQRPDLSAAVIGSLVGNRDRRSVEAMLGLRDRA